MIEINYSRIPMLVIYLLSFSVLVLAVARYQNLQDQKVFVKVHTDTLTGCQYLSTESGCITPRLRVDGSHICNEANEK